MIWKQEFYLGIKEYFKCKQNGISADIYGCSEGRYLECVHYGEGIVDSKDSNPFLK